MSPSQFSEESEQYDSEIVTLFDEAGRSLDCYIENSLDTEDSNYLLLMPVDSPVVILAWDEEDDDDSEAVLIEDREELDWLFADAKAVLAELDLFLKPTAFTLTISGELPPLEEENILTLELDEIDKQLEAEELQFLASFYHKEQKYGVYTSLDPLLFVARSNSFGKLELLSPEDEQLQTILEELLFDELE